MLVDGSGQIKMTKVGQTTCGARPKLMFRTERSFYQKCKSRYAVESMTCNVS